MQGCPPRVRVSGRKARKKEAKMKRNAKWILLALGSLASVMAVAQKGMGGNSSSQAGAQSPSYVGSIPVQEDATS